MFKSCLTASGLHVFSVHAWVLLLSFWVNWSDFCQVSASRIAGAVYFYAGL